MENEWVMMDVQYQCYSLLEGRTWVPLLNTQVTRQTIFEDLQVQHQIPRCFLGKLPCMYIWLVVWNMFYFSNILGTIIPTGEFIFFRGVGSTTNQISKICCWHVCWVLILSFCNLSQVTTADVFSLWQPTGDDELMSTIFQLVSTLIISWLYWIHVQKPTLWMYSMCFSWVLWIFRIFNILSPYSMDLFSPLRLSHVENCSPLTRICESDGPVKRNERRTGREDRRAGDMRVLLFPSLKFQWLEH